MTGRVVFFALAAIPLACSSPGPSSDDTVRSDGRPRNVLLIMADDLGCEWISCYGSEEIETPHVDALAASGLLFENVWSMPKCTPTRVTLLTGQYPFRHGWVNHWDVPRWGAGCSFDPAHYETFVGPAKEAGYATAIAGKWQINDFRVEPDVLARLGFDDWCMWTGYETENPPSAQRYHDPYVFTRTGSRTVEGGYGPDVFTDFLVEFMRENRERPMLLYYPMVLPHGPLTPTPLAPEAEEKRELLRAMVEYVDHCVGRLVTALDELGLREDTLVIFTTDNGSFGMEARRDGRVVKPGKGKAIESGINAPFVASAPGWIPAGTRTLALADFTDLFPTLVDFVGAEVPAGWHLDGSSFLHVLTDPSAMGREWVLSMGGSTSLYDGERVVPRVSYADRVLRTGPYKLWIEEGASTRLYDLESDPGEEQNLIQGGDEPAMRARRFLEGVVATFPAEDASPAYDPVPPLPWDRRLKAPEE